MGMGGVGMGPGMMGGGFERPVEETVVNNYYDQPGGQEHRVDQGGFDQGGRDFQGQDSRGQEQHFHESADQGGAQLSDAGYNSSADDQGNAGYDDSSGDNNIAQDDGSGFDDGGSSDDGGGFDGGGGDFS
jgi:hypothetical protein